MYENLKKANVKEDFSDYEVYHYESESLTSMVRKNLRYGASIRTFVRRTQKPILSSVLKSTLFTIGAIFADLRKYPSVIMGCSLLLLLKAFALVIGFSMRRGFS
jgi:hypothetical protein